MSVGGELAGGAWKVVAHDFSADESSNTVDDLGSEIDTVYSKAINKKFTAGIKYAAYNAGDAGAGKVDADKVWVWLTAKFEIYRYTDEFSQSFYGSNESLTLFYI